MHKGERVQLMFRTGEKSKSFRSIIRSNQKRNPRLSPFVLWLALAWIAGPALAASVTVRVVDENSALLPARLQVIDSLNQPYPDQLNPDLISHVGTIGAYFYCLAGEVEIELPTGVTSINAGCGFERQSVKIFPDIQSDTLLTITLPRQFNMRVEGWFSGEAHSHTQHAPLDYLIPPEKTFQYARAEGLNLLWCLDQNYEFTGIPHGLSTDETALFYAYEHRNQAYGHVCVIGIDEPVSWGCCNNGHAAYPTITDFYTGLTPQWDEAVILTHPKTAAEFFDDDAWPAYGLGRELPVLAALDKLDALDIASYSNSPNIYFQDWYRLLNCGLHIPPASGTDAVMNRYYSDPPGGYRTYVEGIPGQAIDTGLWVANLKEGKTFVTNQPLIPHFSINDVSSGGTLDISEPTELEVRLRVESTSPASIAWLIRNGSVAATVVLPNDESGTAVDTTIQLTETESAWYALRVFGVKDSDHTVGESLFAHSAAIYIDRDNESVRNTYCAGYFLDWIDSLEVFVEIRGQWDYESWHQSVLGQLEDARDFYRGHFTVAPYEFDLREPAANDTLYQDEPALISWSGSGDDETADRITYRVEFATDSLFTLPVYSSETIETSCNLNLPLTPDQYYWWRVKAVDRGLNETISTPGERKVYFSSPDLSGLPDDHTDRDRSVFEPVAMTLWPNPAPGDINIQFSRCLPADGRLSVFDTQGRCIVTSELNQLGRGSGTSLSGDSRGFVWDGRDKTGQRVQCGCYLIRLVTEDPTGNTTEFEYSKRVLVIR